MRSVCRSNSPRHRGFEALCLDVWRRHLGDRDNAGSVRVEPHDDSTSDRPRITEETSGGVQLVPTIGVRWRF